MVTTTITSTSTSSSPTLLPGLLCMFFFSFSYFCPSSLSYVSIHPLSNLGFYFLCKNSHCRINAISSTICVMMGKFLNLSDVRFTHMYLIQGYHEDQIK